MPAYAKQQAGEFLMTGSAVDPVIDCQIGGRCSTSAIGRTRSDRRRSQFDPKPTRRGARKRPLEPMEAALQIAAMGSLNLRGAIGFTHHDPKIVDWKLRPQTLDARLARPSMGGKVAKKEGLSSLRERSGDTKPVKPLWVPAPLSGWSICRAGFAPNWKASPYRGAHPKLTPGIGSRFSLLEIS
jgi:hypothetical protein